MWRDHPVSPDPRSPYDSPVDNLDPNVVLGLFTTTIEPQDLPFGVKPTFVEARGSRIVIEGEAHKLEPPFMVLATQNPIEYEGTFPLPEAQLDRFMMRIRLGYPRREEEVTVLDQAPIRGSRRSNFSSAASKGSCSRSNAAFPRT